MNFIDTEKGYINLDHVRRVEILYRDAMTLDRPFSRLYDADDRLVATANHDVTDELTTKFIVPAIPGYFLIDRDSANDFPVLAWIVYEGYPISDRVDAVVLYGVHPIPFSILAPDGTVTDVSKLGDAKMYPTRDAWNQSPPRQEETE